MVPIESDPAVKQIEVKTNPTQSYRSSLPVSETSVLALQRVLKHLEKLNQTTFQK